MRRSPDRAAASERAVQIDAALLPASFHGAFRHTSQGSDFRERESAEEAEIDDLGERGIVCRELVERIAETLQRLRVLHACTTSVTNVVWWSPPPRFCARRPRTSSMMRPRITRAAYDMKRARSGKAAPSRLDIANSVMSPGSLVVCGWSPGSFRAIFTRRRRPRAGVVSDGGHEELGAHEEMSHKGHELLATKDTKFTKVLRSYFVIFVIFVASLFVPSWPRFSRTSD